MGCSVKAEGRTRRIRIENGLIDLSAVAHPDGTLEVLSLKLLNERASVNRIPESDILLAEQRVGVCEACEQFQGATMKAKGRDVYTVKCKACGCGGLSLVRGKCPKKRWP